MMDEALLAPLNRLIENQQAYIETLEAANAALTAERDALQQTVEELTADKHNLMAGLYITTTPEAGWPDGQRAWYVVRDPQGQEYGGGYTPRAAWQDVEFDAFDGLLSSVAPQEQPIPLTAGAEF